MPLIDTLTLKTGLLEGGMPEPQAAAIVRALADADVGQLATKADLSDLRAELREEIANLRTILGAEIADVRTELRTEVEALRGDLKALNGKVNLLLAFNTPLLLVVLALLWRIFFMAAN